MVYQSMLDLSLTTSRRSKLIQIRDLYWYTAGAEFRDMLKKMYNDCINIDYCSAGVGRTGTLIAIDIALEQASKERQVDIPKIVVGMRKQRMKMVQTAVSVNFSFVRL